MVFTRRRSWLNWLFSADDNKNRLWKFPGTLHTWCTKCGEILSFLVGLTIQARYPTFPSLDHRKSSSVRVLPRLQVRGHGPKSMTFACSRRDTAGWPVMDLWLVSNMPCDISQIYYAEQRWLPFQNSYLPNLGTAQHYSGNHVSHLHMLMFVSLSWCHIVPPKSFTHRLNRNHTVHTFSATFLSLFFCFAGEEPTSGGMQAWLLSDWTWLCASPFLSSLRGNLRPPRIYNSLQGCSSTPGCQTIQMRHHRSPFSSTLQAIVFTVQSQWLTLWRG